MASQPQPLLPTRGTDDTDERPSPFAKLPEELKIMIYKQAMMPFGKQRLVVLKVTHGAGDHGLNPPPPPSFELMNAEALEHNDPIKVAQKFRQVCRSAARVATRHLSDEPEPDSSIEEVSNRAPSARLRCLSSSMLMGYKAVYPHDLVFIFNVPTTYDWEPVSSWLGYRGHRPRQRRNMLDGTPSRSSLGFTHMVMIPATEMRYILQSTALYGNISTTASRLKRLVVVADQGDNAGAFERMKAGKVEMDDLVLADASRYWARREQDMGVKGQRLHTYEAELVEREWGLSISRLGRMWVEVYLEAQLREMFRSPLQSLDIEAGMPELWFARIKEI